jgi:parallel beta-helix repeat protein
LVSDSQYFFSLGFFDFSICIAQSSSSPCPKGALRVQPGLNSLSKAVKKAKEQGIGSLFLLNGVHDEKGEQVCIDFSLKVVGQNQDDVKIRGGLQIYGTTEEAVFLSDCTVTGAKGYGVHGHSGNVERLPSQYNLAAMHLKNVCVEKCGDHGVLVQSTTRNTMTNCNVNNNKGSGVCVTGGGCMIIDGSSATTIHHNGTRGSSYSYGLYAHGSRNLKNILHTSQITSSIHLKSFTNESISTNNGGGGNYGGNGNYFVFFSSSRKNTKIKKKLRSGDLNKYYFHIK